MAQGYRGVVAIENYWGTKLSSISIAHACGNLENTNGFVNDIEHGERKEYVFHFYYLTGLFPPKNTWKVSVATIDGHLYETDGYFSCSIKDKDDGRVIIGVNGEAKTAYVAYANSGSCSEGLMRIK